MSSSLLCLAISLVSFEVDGKYAMTEKSVSTACSYTESLLENAAKYKIDPFVMAAIAWNESRWTPSAFDGACCGIAQINPSFVPENCQQLKDPATSLHRMAAILDGWRPLAPKGVDEEVHMIACYAAGTVCTKSSKAVKHAKHILKLASVYKASYTMFSFVLPWRLTDGKSPVVF